MSLKRRILFRGKQEKLFIKGELDYMGSGKGEK